jgi:hypothetical protein
MVGADSPHRVSDRAGHTGSGALCGGANASIAPSESNRGGQLARKELAFGSCLLRPRGISHCSRLFQIVLNLIEPPAVRLLRARIEQLAGIACIRESPGRLVAEVVSAGTPRSTPTR